MRVFALLFLPLVLAACSSRNVEPTPTPTKTPTSVVQDSMPTMTPEPVEATAPPAERQSEPTTVTPLPENARTDEVTAARVLGVLMAQHASKESLLKLAAELQSNEIDGIGALGGLTAAGGFAAAARDAANEEYPADLVPHVEAARSNAAILDSVIRAWMDKEIDSSDVPGLLVDINIEADIEGLGGTLRSIGFSDADLERMLDQIQMNLETEP